MKIIAVIIAYLTGMSFIINPISVGGDGRESVTTTTGQPPKIVYVPLQKPSVTTTSSTTTTTLPATDCAEWYATAISVGWPVELWQKMSKIMHRESRCIASVFNDTDPYGGSIGLMQINMFWCKAHRGNEQGYLQSANIITDCIELFDPATNLRAALAIYQYSEQRQEGGWKPWGK